VTFLVLILFEISFFLFLSGYVLNGLRLLNSLLILSVVNNNRNNRNSRYLVNKRALCFSLVVLMMFQNNDFDDLEFLFI